MEKIGRVILAVIITALIAGVSCYYVGKSAGRTEMVVEAVGNNYGHYKILNDLGVTQFEWGPPPAGYPLVPPKK